MPSPAEPPGATPDLGDLMHVAFRRLRHRWSEQLAPFDLSPYQFRALQAIGGGAHRHAEVLRGRSGSAPAVGGDGPALDPDGGASAAVARSGPGAERGTAPAPGEGAEPAPGEGAEPASGQGTTPEAGACAGTVSEGLRLKDLAERLRIAPRSATEVVDQLQAKGLVERRPDPADRRATRIVLTDRGAEVRSQVREERRRQAGDYFSVLSEPDRAELARLLGELVRGRP